MSPQSVPPLALLMLPHLSGEGIFLVLSKPALQRHHELQRSLTLMSLVLWAKFLHSPIGVALGNDCPVQGMGIWRSGKGT